MGHGRFPFHDSIYLVGKTVCMCARECVWRHRCVCTRTCMGVSHVRAHTLHTETAARPLRRTPHAREASHSRAQRQGRHTRLVRASGGRGQRGCRRHLPRLRRPGSAAPGAIQALNPPRRLGRRDQGKEAPLCGSPPGASRGSPAAARGPTPFPPGGQHTPPEAGLSLGPPSRAPPAPSPGSQAPERARPAKERGPTLSTAPPRPPCAPRAACPCPSRRALLATPSWWSRVTPGRHPAQGWWRLGTAFPRVRWARGHQGERRQAETAG